jgi:L-seryl-tRNA(Ser) seleniumtransferase
MYAALEAFLAQDFDKVWKSWEAGIAHIENAVKKVGGITTEVTVNPLGNHTPSLRIVWDPNKIKMSGKELQEKLRAGNPSIEVGGSQGNSINVTVWMMKPGQEKIVAKRITEELAKTSA